MAQLLSANLSVIVLAAGRGTRMAAMAASKLLLPWRDGRPVLWHAVAGALALRPAEVVLVVRPDLLALQEAVAGLPVRCVPNPRYAEGMATSLVAGLEALSPGTGPALLLLGDEPEVDPAIVERLFAAYRVERKPVTIPRYGDEVGPPTLFSREVFPELLRLEGDSGARALVARHPEMVCFVPFAPEDRPRDIDTPDDYALP